MEPSTPPSASQAPPPPRSGGTGRFQRTHVVEGSGPRSGGGVAPSPPAHYPPSVPPRHQASPPRPDAARAPAGMQPAIEDLSDSWSEGKDDDGRGNPNAIIPAGLTEDAVQRAFGNGPNPSAAAPAGGRAGAGASGAPAATAATLGGATPPGGRRPGGIIMPTRKQGSDSVSMYSMSQSVLPLDPRERIYYRPRRHLLQCYVERRKLQGGVLASLLPGESHKSFQFFLEHTNDFVLAAVLRTTKARARVEDTSDGVGGRFYSISKGGGNITFSINQQQLDGDSRSFVGKLSRRGNGLEMVMFSEGDKTTRKEIMAVLLESFGDTSRSSFTVLLPAIDAESGYMKPLEGGQVRFLRDGRGGTSVAGGSRAGIDAAMAESSEEESSVVTPTTGSAPPTFNAVDGTTAAPGNGTGSGPNAAANAPSNLRGVQRKWLSHGVLAREYKRDPHSPHLIVLKNKVPQWDGVLRGYKLDFHGRATKASEKNFQLVATTDPEKVVMLFGKQSDDRFALDFRYPLCGLQAAAIAATIMTARKLIH